jgi:hypothetical protein
MEQRMTRMYDALTWATKLMPTGKAQAALTDAYNQAMREASDETGEDRVIMLMAGAVIDGLCYGNWIGHTNSECMDMAQAKAARAAARGE